MKEWFAFFSQSGSEIYELSKKLGRFPDRIITNKPLEKLTTINANLLTEFKGVWVFLPQKPSVEQYVAAINSNNEAFITLHGYLRIIPKDICNIAEIYNGHPGDIVKYPELKGFNPQEKAFNLKLPTSGSVIHRVTADVDEGPISRLQTVSIEGLSLDEVYKVLHSNSVSLWYNFLKHNLKQ